DLARLLGRQRRDLTGQLRRLVRDRLGDAVPPLAALYRIAAIRAHGAHPAQSQGLRPAPERENSASAIAVSAAAAGPRITPRRSRSGRRATAGWSGPRCWR